MSVLYSGEQLGGEIEYFGDMPKYLEFHIPNYSIGENLLQDMGLRYFWVDYPSKILRMDILTPHAGHWFNLRINSVDVFQEGINSKENIWRHSGLCSENNTIQAGGRLEISSDSEGSNLFVRVWYLHV